MKQIIAILILSITVHSASSQNVGVRVNYVISNWEGLIYVSDMQTETLANFSFGIYGHAPLNPSIVFEPGIFITPKGAKMMNGPFTEPTSNKSLYLDVPILVKMYIGGGGFHVNAGPQVSYLLSNKMLSESGDELDTTNELIRWDFAMVFGLAFDFKFGLNLGASYDLGLTNMLFNDYYEWTEARNRLLRFSLGYTIGVR
jgi:hypothetical protein